MRVVDFLAENVLKLKVVEIHPKGNVVQLTGPNGSGKTSVLNSILFTLAGTEDLPSKPIHRGADKGGVRISLGDKFGDWEVIRKFSEGGTTLSIRNKNGDIKSKPQAWLKSLFGDLAFDPLAFTRMKEAEQAAELRKLVRLEIDPDKIDQANKADYDERRIVNRNVESYRARIAGISVVGELPEKPIDITALIAELENAGRFNSDLVNQSNDKLQKARFVTETREAAIRLQEQIVELMRQVKQLEETSKQKLNAADEMQKVVEGITIADPVDTAELREQIENARATNSQIQRRTERETIEGELKAEQAKADALTAAMKAREEAKANAIGQAEMPIPGLGFQDGEVYYMGLPLNQASGAEQLRVSLAIAMASNKEARVILITDGSLLDEKSMEIVTRMAEDRDYQVWIERVDTTGKIGIVMEDGMVAAVNDDALNVDILKHTVEGKMSLDKPVSPATDLQVEPKTEARKNADAVLARAKAGKGKK